MDTKTTSNTSSSTEQTTTLDKEAIMTLILESGTVDYVDSDMNFYGKFRLKDNMTSCDLLCTNLVRNQHVIHSKDEKNGVWRHQCSACGRTKSPCDSFMLPKNANVNRIFDDYHRDKY